MIKLNTIIADFWGGTAAMLVALPSAIAFGVTIYATIGGHYGAYGAVAGILGVAAIGIIASLFGGTNRLISAPSAPAAAVLSAFALTYISKDFGPDTVFAMLMVVALLAGIFQVLFGLIGLGKLIKYMPFPVVSGYLSGVGLYIIASQTPKFLGLPQGTHILEALKNPTTWQWESMTVGFVTILTMFYADKIVRIIPAVILALIIGVLTYGLLGIADPLLFVPNNPLVIGELGGSNGINFLQMFIGRFNSLATFSLNDLSLLLFPALTLAALLSIDTLKTCVIIDSMTHSFHNSNRELIAQGSGNITSSLIGGMSGSGTMGATMVNLSSGAQTSLSGVIEGVMAILAFLLLGTFIAWIPVAALAGILIVIGLRMIDRHSIKLLKTSKTALDFFIIVVVALTALTVSLIAAAGVGLVLAIVLYIIQQIGVSVIYRQQDGSEMKSKIIRSNEDELYLTERSNEYSLYELHGSLFFGTANQLYTMLQEDLRHKKYIILDMKRVQTVDLTAAHILLQIKDILHDAGGYLILSRLPHKLPSGDDMESYFNHVGLLKHLSPIKVFDDLDDALEWVEEKLLAEEDNRNTKESLLSLGDFNLFKGRKADTLAELEMLLVNESYKKGETIYTIGESTGEIFLIRRGSVRIMLPFNEQKHIHLNTLTQGSFFGEFSFLEGTPHYTDTIAASDTELYMISRETYDLFSTQHKKAALHFMESLATVLAERLKVTRNELAVENDV
ncbi:MAG: SulP family inorganic anion transporter [Sulfuricurvum sp.]|uniref:SulP family inorganic anion transporter n=1 Tax=Sulfuricurvum sp. TaxID=2025608 RepID=UPI002607E480|nr:SulP family inorganic anion transporter [Sulfuricurvum sp.]MDD2830483.1 SulP family inorganic anion transporter [Sulfuricurvum sp.]MDD4949948.1 SulP family inorganic anion transporter [Sulfuricurvum sp.]